MAASTHRGGGAVPGAMHRAAADGTPDLQTLADEGGTCRFASADGLAPFGWLPADLCGRSLLDFAHPDDRGSLDDAHRAAWSGGATVTTTYRLSCADGSYRWVESRSRSIGAGVDRLVVAAVRDVAERRASEVRLQLQATSDPLTGVANRAAFMDRAGHALRRLDRLGGVVAVLYLDLDRFKLINDSLGHRVGDAVLVQLAERLLRVLRPHDTLARLGGDEFAVIVEDLSDAEEAVALGARIVEAGRTPFVVGEEQFVCTTSVGVAVTSDPAYSAERLLREADLALYRAKDRGRDRADVFDEDLRTRAASRLGTERMLRRAIVEDRLRLAYQPIIDLATGATVAAEALVRIWDATAGELILAEAFIDVAEETDLVTEIDRWVLGTVIEHAVARHTLPGPDDATAVAINLSARDLADAGFARSVIDDLTAHDLPADALQIEVTERVLMEATNSARSGLRLLRAAGVKVALDHFGTGYSSLSYLRSHPVDVVKIDRSVVSGLVAGAADRAIVASIIDLSHALGMSVVAEGVETSAQAEVLADLGCDHAQGFHFARPGPDELVERAVPAMVRPRTSVPV